MASDATVDDAQPVLAEPVLAEPVLAEPVLAEPVLVDAGPPVAELRCPFGSSAPAAPGSRPRPKRGYLVPGIIALVVCAAIGVVIDVTGIQSHPPANLAAGQVEAFISQSLQATHPQSSPPQVRCPAAEPLRAGYTFNCVLVADGPTAGVIKVTETSSNGTFRFQPPAAT